MTYRLVLDDIDPTMLELANANKRLHWARKARITAYWRSLAWVVGHGYRVPVPTPMLDRAHVTVTITWPDARRRDVGNWAPLAKAIIDGLTDAQWWPDDNSDHVIGPDLRRGEPGPRQVAVEITPLDSRDGAPMSTGSDHGTSYRAGPPDWRDASLCRSNPDLWFADGRSGQDQAERAEAIRICGLCTARHECLDDALERETPSTRHGIRGGLTEDERAALVERQRRARRRAP